MGDGLRVAVQGCCHGELDAIYSCLQEAERKAGERVDLLLLCGDVQCVRCQADLESMAVPPKFRCMNTFHEYIVGLKSAPVMTIFIGGNHEASNVLHDLPFGGFVAPRIYYMGNGNVVWYRGLRIGGISGIFDKKHFHLPHFEVPPYSADSLRSVYHSRAIDHHRLALLASAPNEHVPDVFLSHDWPQGVYHHGDTKRLLALKPYFRDEVNRNELGSPPLRELLQALKPRFWFAAHLHVRFAASIAHEGAQPSVTRFLALDKVIPGRAFMQFLTVPVVAPELLTDEHLRFDVPFMSIIRKTYHLTCNESHVRLEQLQAAQPLCEAHVADTHCLLARSYGSELRIPNMLPVLDAEAFTLCVSTRGNAQTERMLGALQLPHSPPYIRTMDPAARAALERYLEPVEATEPDWKVSLAVQAMGSLASMAGAVVGDPNEVDI